MTPPESEWVCLWCAAHIITPIPLTAPPTHWCNGRGHRQYDMEPIKIGGDTPDAA